MTNPKAKIIARANLPTRHGPLVVCAFDGLSDGEQHIAIVKGDIRGATALRTRLHSQCITGDVFSSLRCDCREQLELGLEHIASLERGLVLYLRQEGRGIGLTNKIRAYQLQDEGLDTVEANRRLGFRDDERDYGAAAEMLACLGVTSVELMTNNPDKVSQLENHGVVINNRIAHEIRANCHNRLYLETKKEKSGHLLGLSNLDWLPRCDAQSLHGAS